MEYSVDGGQSYTLCPSAATGADYVHLRSLPWWDASLAGNRYNTCSSAGIGLTDHLFRLPAEVFGRERVMVRLRPYDKVMTVLPLVWNGDTETAETAPPRPTTTNCGGALITRVTGSVMLADPSYGMCPARPSAAPRGLRRGRCGRRGRTPSACGRRGDPAAEGGCGESGMRWDWSGEPRALVNGVARTVGFDADGVPVVGADVSADGLYTVHFPADAYSRAKRAFVLPPAQFPVSGGSLQAAACPMYGTVRTTGDAADVTLSPLCGVVRIPLAGDAHIASVRVEDRSGGAVSGLFPFDPATPEIVRNGNSGNLPWVVLDCAGTGGGVRAAASGTEFCVAVPAGYYASGLSVRVTDCAPPLGDLGDSRSVRRRGGRGEDPCAAELRSRAKTCSSPSISTTASGGATTLRKRAVTVSGRQFRAVAGHIGGDRGGLCRQRGRNARQRAFRDLGL